MTDLLTIENLGNLLMLCFLQAVLGFDNLLYISIESQRAPVAQQAAVSKVEDAYDDFVSKADRLADYLA